MGRSSSQKEEEEEKEVETTTRLPTRRDRGTRWQNIPIQKRRGRLLALFAIYVVLTYSEKKRKVEHFVFSFFFRLCFRGKTNWDVNGLSGCLFSVPRLLCCGWVCEKKWRGRPPQIPKKGVGGWHTTGGGGNGYLRLPSLLTNSPIFSKKSSREYYHTFKGYGKNKKEVYLFIYWNYGESTSVISRCVCVPSAQKRKWFLLLFSFSSCLRRHLQIIIQQLRPAAVGARLRLRLDLRGTSREEVWHLAVARNKNKIEMNQFSNVIVFNKKKYLERLLHRPIHAFKSLKN